jgi:hypothetical protein
MIDWLAADLTAAQLEALPVNLSFYRTAETRAFGSADASASPEDGRRDTPSPDSRILTDLTFNPDDGVFHVEALDWPLPEPDGVGSERAEQTRRAIISYLDYITWGQSTCDAAELARRIDHAARRLHELGLRVIANYDLIASAHDDRSLEQAPFTPDDPDENSPF